MPEHRTELIEAFESIDLGLYRAHPETVTATDIADWQARCHEATVGLVDLLRDDQELIDLLDARVKALEESPRIVTGISTTAWIVIWFSFCMGLLIGGLLL